MPMIPARPVSTEELSASERWLLHTMQSIGFGRIEFLQIRNGEPISVPAPTLVRDIKFAAETPTLSANSVEFELKHQVAELFAYTRSVRAGEIRTLEIRHGLPFAMEVEIAATPSGQEGDRD